MAVRAQLLEGRRPAGVLSTVQRLGCLQLDPISVVARSHELVVYSRLGAAFDPAELAAELWSRRTLFEYWAHAASIVLAEDYGIHHVLMRRYGTRTSPRHRREQLWYAENRRLRDHILRRLRREGPLRSRDFVDLSTRIWESEGWNTGRTVSWMLESLWTRGRVLVAGRRGGDRLWDLAERVLPAGVLADRVSERQATLRAIERALRALGVATEADISRHFTRGRYPRLAARLGELAVAGRVVPVTVDGVESWVHADALSDLDDIEAGGWEPRTTVLSPFDNLVCDRARAERLFGFDYRVEIYVPKAKRRYGYYVLPVLAGDRLVARTDAAYDRQARALTVHSVHPEPGASRAGRRAADEALGALDGWLRARSRRGGTAG